MEAAQDRRYLVDGAAFTLAEMLAVNTDDDYVCDWCRAAKIGDVLDGLMGESVECVAAQDAARLSAREIATLAAVSQ